jgi:isopentenyldiphosphate isomerase
MYEREGKSYALFQKRSAAKKIAPGKFDVSVGGHYAAGENAATAGPREIKEELGLDVKFDDLLPIGRRVFVYCFTPGVKEYEFQDVFLLPRTVQPQEVTLQEEEVDALLAMEVELGIKLFSREIPQAECRLFISGAPAEQIEVSVAEFVPCLDNYYLKLLLLAQRYFSGERTCLII